jgi:predicted nuclease of restriction endonuclease-like (RecB) superfamily
LASKPKIGLSSRPKILFFNFKRMRKMDLTVYSSLLSEIKSRIRTAQIKATLAANAEMIVLYWDIGKMILQRQQLQGWSARVIPKLANDLKNELPELKGFSERNLSRMLAFHREYPDESILPQPVAKLIHAIPWGHHIILIEKVKNRDTRFWYMQQVVQNGWSRDVLSAMIKTNVFERQGAATTNFETLLPNPQSDLAKQTLKDPYIFDFLTLSEPFAERELETELVKHIEKFLLELGAGFAFVGRQYHLEVGGNDFYLDLLFYHLKMRRFVVIDLKKGAFKPEYAGKMNFYCSAVDDLLKHPTDQATIGLILCENKNKIIAEYALRDNNKPIGISEFELTKALPDDLKPSLPSIEEIEKELSLDSE